MKASSAVTTVPSAFLLAEGEAHLDLDDHGHGDVALPSGRECYFGRSCATVGLLRGHGSRGTLPGPVVRHPVVKTGSGVLVA